MGSGPDSVYGVVAISLGAIALHGTQKCARESSSPGPGPSPLLGALKAVNLGKHICNFILQFLWTHIQGSGWKSCSACGSGSSLSLLSPTPFLCPFFIFKAGAQYLCVLLCLHQPSFRGWESLCTHLTLFSACSLSPCGREVSCPLFPPNKPSLHLADSSPQKHGIALPCSEFLCGSPWPPRAWIPSFVQHHIFSVTCQ